MPAAMISTDKFIPFAELRRLTSGSLESRIHEVREVVLAGCGALRSPEVISTFESGAVIFAADMFHRVDLARAEDGTLCITKISPMEVDLYEVTQRERYLMQEARNVVDLVLEGSLDAAFEHARELASMVESDPRGADSRWLRVVETVLGVDRPWRRVLDSRRARFESLGPAYPPIELDKYARLSDADGANSGHESVINRDIQAILARISALENATHSALGRLLEAPDSDAISHARGFVSDLLEDLRCMKEHTTRVAGNLSLVEYRGKLRDVVAGALPDYQLAVGFVEKVLSRLAEDQ